MHTIKGVPKEGEDVHYTVKVNTPPRPRPKQAPRTRKQPQNTNREGKTKAHNDSLMRLWPPARVL